MELFSKKFFEGAKILSLIALLVLVSPFIAIGEGNSISTTTPPEAIIPPEPPPEAVSTTTPEFNPEGEQKPEVLGVQEGPEEPIEELVVEEVWVSDYVPAFIPENLPKIFARVPEKIISIDPEASHSCKIDVFEVDMSEKDVEHRSIKIYQNESEPYSLEVVGLPQGFKVSFPGGGQGGSQGDAQKGGGVYEPKSGESLIEIDINKKDDAQKGSFSVSFVFSKKNTPSSSVVCQMNILNS